jgi:porin
MRAVARRLPRASCDRSSLLGSILIFWLLILASNGAVSNDEAVDQPARAPDSGPDSGPISTESQLEADSTAVDPVLRLQWVEDAMEPYYRFKREVDEKLGLDFGADYTAVFQGASRSPGRNAGSGGIFRLFGVWTPYGRESGNTGSLVYKIEHRHKLWTSTAAQDLSSEIGYVGITALAYSDYRNAGWGLTNLFWQQRFGGGRVKAVAGIVDPTDYLDIYGLMNPWTQFLNVAFSTNPSIFLVNQGVGAAIGVQATDNIYAILGASDANADPVDPIGSVDTFFDDAEFFKHLELGWSSSVDERLFLDNVHVTVWQVDKQSNTGGDDGWGIAGSAAWAFDDRWYPFVRAGYSKDGSALYEGSVSWGVGYYFARRGDLASIGLNWTRPSDGTLGPGLDDQYTMELFYRIQLAKDLAVTPDVQLIINPALNPEDDSVFIAGIRLRLAI